MIKNKHISDKSGFTIVELLVVIVVIGILATIGLIQYVGMQDRAREAVLRSDLTSAAEILNIDQVRTGSYPGEMSEADRGNGLPASVDTEYQYTPNNSAEPPTFCLTGINGMVALHITQEGVVNEGTCEGDHGPIAGGGGDEDEGDLPGSDSETVFVFDTTAPGCGGTVRLPFGQYVSGGTVDWGDGVVEAVTSISQSHTYSSPGSYNVVYEGPIKAITVGGDKNCLTRVDQWGSGAEPTRISFMGVSNLEYVAEPPTTVTEMNGMFSGVTSFNQPIGDWDVSNVTNMRAMFSGASSFNQPIGDWDVSKVKDMETMFSGATSFSQDINGWNVSSATNMRYMFMNATSFNQPIGDWDVSNVTNMYGMFSGTAKSFNQDISGWDVSSVTNMETMFYGATSFNQDISGWNVTGVASWQYFRLNSGLSLANTPLKFR